MPIAGWAVRRDKAMIEPTAFLAALKSHGVTSILSLPCSSFAGLLQAVDADPELEHLLMTSEAEGVGIAAGCWLSGLAPAVLIQNSGFADAINPICSLLDTFRIPVPFFVSVRGGYGVADEPQHDILGSQFEAIVRALGLPLVVLPDDGAAAAEVVDRVFTQFIAKRQSVVIAVPMRTFAPPQPSATDQAAPTEQLPSRGEILEALRSAAPADAVFVCSTGYIGRDLFLLGDRPSNIYVAGSMGCASAIGYAISRHCERPVFVLDGDGAALMRMGNFATLANQQCGRLVHVVFNNGVYESTGGQVNFARGVDFVGVAKACGYSKLSRRMRDSESIGLALDEINRGLAPGQPVLIDMLTCSQSAKPAVRPDISYPDQAARLRSLISAHEVLQPAEEGVFG